LGNKRGNEDTGVSREVATQGRAERFMPLSPKTCQGNKHYTFANQGEQSAKGMGLFLMNGLL